MSPVNLFYAEPDPDRWLPGDRYPRRLVRGLVRGPARVGGQHRVFLNLCAGLDLLGASYRTNDYRYAREHPEEVVGVVGKPHLLDIVPWRNPILFGASVFSHPLDDLNLFERLPVKLVLVPGEWMRRMFEPYYGSRVAAWSVGIDTDHWKPTPDNEKSCDVLIYNKIRWDYDRHEISMLAPIREHLRKRGLTFLEIRYGHYEEMEFRNLLKHARGMLFLCEHETQGIAYQQALSCGIPILAWDRGGFWQDPSYFPAKVQFEPVTSVPYWDERCGLRFTNLADFPDRLDVFINRQSEQDFDPREFVLENLTLGACAQTYLKFFEAVSTKSPL